MNGRSAYRIAYDKEMKKKQKDKNDTLMPIKARGNAKKNQDFHCENVTEEKLALAIDNVKVIKKYSEHFNRLEKTKDVMGFIQDLSPSMAESMFLLTQNAESEKIKLEALKDLLDRAGYGKVNKHAVARFDTSDSRELISSILGAKKDLGKIGIEIVDEDHKERSGEADEG